MKCKGQITVFTSLLFMCILSLFLRVFESARTAGLQYYFELAGNSVLESIFAGYNKELFQRYGLLFLDMNYGDIQREVKDYFSYYGDPDQGLWKKGGNSFYMDCGSVDMLSCITASDEGGKIFWQSAIDSLGYSVAGDILDRFLRWNRLREEGEENKRRIEEDVLSDKAFGELEELEGFEIEQGAMDRIFQKLGEFHLGQVLPDTGVISDQYADLSDVPSKYAQEDPEKADLLKESAFLLYIRDNFSCFTTRKSNGYENTVLNYEQEYILGGFASDEENLGAAVGKILLLREAMNTINVLNDEALMDTIHLISSGIALVLELPLIQESIKCFLITAFAYSYALGDVGMLLRGERVPVVNSLEKQEEGLDYEDYLTIIMFTQNRLEKRYRAMDLVEMNLRSQYPGFSLDRCLWKLELRLTAVCADRKERSGIFIRRYQ